MVKVVLKKSTFVLLLSWESGFVHFSTSKNNNTFKVSTNSVHTFVAKLQFQLNWAGGHNYGKPPTPELPEQLDFCS